MRRRMRVYAVAILTACLVLVGLPAVALEYEDDYIDLPFTSYGDDMLADAAHDQVFVSGGSGTNEGRRHVRRAGPSAPGRRGDLLRVLPREYVTGARLRELAGACQETDPGADTAS